MDRDQETRSSTLFVAVGAGLWLLSVGVLLFLFFSVPPPFQNPWIFMKWLVWCVALGIAGLTFMTTWEFLNPLLNGSGEPGEAIIRTGAFGIGILVVVFLVIRIFLD